VLALRKLRDPPRPPQVYVTDLESRWQKVILRCLDGDPKKRFTSATDVVRELEGRQRICRWWIPAVAALACACILMIPPARAKAVSTSAMVAAYFTSQRTVALLPFANENTSPENQAFSVGLASAVTDQLRTLSHDDRPFMSRLLRRCSTPASTHRPSCIRRLAPASLSRVDSRSKTIAQ
jgi:hypothetical protein